MSYYAFLNKIKQTKRSHKITKFPMKIIADPRFLKLKIKCHSETVTENTKKCNNLLCFAHIIKDRKNKAKQTNQKSKEESF